MKSITRLSLALMMFALLSVSYLVTTVSAGDGKDHNRGIKNQWGFRPGTHAPNINLPHTPDNTNDQGASGSNYRLNQPVNQGGINGVMPGGPGPR